MKFKRIIAMIMLITIAVLSVSCRKKVKTTIEVQDVFDLDKNVGNRKVAVAYFSLNDDTKDVATRIAEAFEVDLIEIEPAVPYTEEDLDYSNFDSRVHLEADFNPLYKEEVRADEEYEPSYGMPPIPTKSEIEKKEIKELPKIKGNSADRYDIIILGFPEWYEDAPKVIYTFLKDMKNKIIIPFCVDGEMGFIDQYLSEFVDNSVSVMSGRKLAENVTEQEIKDWITLYSADFDLK